MRPIPLRLLRFGEISEWFFFIIIIIARSALID